MADTVFDESAGLPPGFVALFERSTVSMSVADFTRPDCPLVGANRHFFELCGYEPEEVIGRNCRFLQPEGGAGPVRDRIRDFLADPRATNDKFLVPNQTKQGAPFLNLIYLAKLTKLGKTRLVLGSQFQVGRAEANAELYDRALEEDLRQLNLLTSESNWSVLGTFEALASSHSIIAQARFEEG